MLNEKDKHMKPIKKDYIELLHALSSITLFFFFVTKPI